MKKTLLLTLCVIGSFAINAQTEFTANEDNNWNNPENWTNGLPDSVLKRMKKGGSGLPE